MNDQTWTSRELPMLRAIRRAEEAGEDVNAAARRAAGDLSSELYGETINSLHVAGYLEAAVTSTGGGKLMVHVKRLLPRGREAVGQWLPSPPTALVGERRRQRLQFMDTLYNEVGDNTLATIDVGDLTEQFGWSKESADGIVGFLAAEGLIETMMGDQVSITHAGIVEVEQSRARPDEPTQHFPPPSAVYIGGDAQGLQISIGSPGSSQHLQLSESSIDVAGDFVAEFRRVFADLPLEEDYREAVRASLDAAEALLAAPRRDQRALSAILGGLRDVALGMAGNAAFNGLVELAGKLT